MARQNKEKLVIVESPAKARTLGRFLGKGYRVRASLGHVRDLPKRHLGVEIGKDFAPRYVVLPEKRQVVTQLREAASRAASIYLATDPDREGEAISWHLVQAARLDNLPLYRVVFHEITDRAVREAFRHPRGIDMNLVNAQQARRILDRLGGYKLSPLLWRKVRRGLSAGRVQSAALRMIVDRERLIQNFVPEEYWTIEAELAKRGVAPSFRASLVGEPKPELHSQQETEQVVAELRGAEYKVSHLQEKMSQRQPPPPFITSTLQQEAWRKLRFSAEHTMAVAQQLYEGLPLGEEGAVGLITYMRTDSPRVAASAIREVREFIRHRYGIAYLPPHPRHYASRSKTAQEAHEAIRPTLVGREPELVKPYLDRDQFRLYQLIWKRMVASQMAAIQLRITTVDVQAHNPQSKRDYLLRATSSRVTFPGFSLLYSEGRDEEAEEAKAALPELSQGDPLELLGLFPEQHFTQPPPRYTEATLIQALEDNGIGRPSTYAPILSTLGQRNYVEKVDGRFRPLELGFIVTDLLLEHFPDIVDLKFTAELEEKLDDIARGERGWVPMLQEFYSPFEATLAKASSAIEKVKMADEPAGEDCPHCGRPMVVKTGRYGKFIACSGYPQCKTSRPFMARMGISCPECGGELVQRLNRKRQVFYGCANFPECQFATNRCPLPQPCPRCGGLVTQRGRDRGKCLKCGHIQKITEPEGIPVSTEV
ncbi:MAG TPA: type I DNA topoisomerase [Dehalococcoidia bacterium]|nr:type I DNA topoisomerase [Dehalococcoidia bacterium]